MPDRADFRDLYENTHDHNQTGSGIRAVLSKFMDRLHTLDPVLYKDMVEKGIEPAYFAFRWFSLAMAQVRIYAILCYCLLGADSAQDFDLPDVIRIWDSLLASRVLQTPEVPDYLTDFCCAMLLTVRTDLIQQSFSDNIKMLQQYPSIDISTLLALTLDLRARRRPMTFPSGMLGSSNDDLKGRASSLIQQLQQSASTKLDRPFNLANTRVSSFIPGRSRGTVDSNVQNTDALLTDAGIFPPSEGFEVLPGTEGQAQQIGPNVYHVPKDYRPDTTDR